MTETPMTETDRKAFEDFVSAYDGSHLASAVAVAAWQAALTHARGKQEPEAWHYLDQYEGYVVSRNHPIKTSEDRWATEIRPATIETLIKDREALVQEAARLRCTFHNLEKEVNRLGHVNRDLRAALAYYANKDNWVTADWGDDQSTPNAIPMVTRADGETYCDCGDTARKALDAHPTTLTLGVPSDWLKEKSEA